MKLSSKDANDILEACQIMINEAIKNAKFNRDIQASIIAINTDGTYDIKYQNGIANNVKADPDKTFAVNDVCWVEVPNNEMSLFYIKCKKK